MYPGTSEPAVDKLSLEVPAGEICVLVGPSGCGKTTAMRMVNRLIDITSGDILIDGESVKDRKPAELRREIGYAIQQIGLFPHLTVGENIATVPKLLGWDKAAHPRARGRAARAHLAGPRRGPRPLPVAALRRPAPARRRRPRPRRRPARPADGRALRRDRPDQPRAAAERVPAPAGQALQDDRLRHARHRRGDQDGRQDRGAQEGRPPRPVRVARRDADPTRPTSSSSSSSAPTARSSASRSSASATSTCGRSRRRRPGDYVRQLRTAMEDTDLHDIALLRRRRRQAEGLAARARPAGRARPSRQPARRPTRPRPRRHPARRARATCSATRRRYAPVRRRQTAASPASCRSRSSPTRCTCPPRTCPSSRGAGRPDG